MRDQVYFDELFCELVGRLVVMLAAFLWRGTWKRTYVQYSFTLSNTSVVDKDGCIAVATSDLLAGVFHSVEVGDVAMIKGCVRHYVSY
jgi:hypothetical protein